MSERVWKLGDFKACKAPDSDTGMFTLRSEGITFAVAVAGPPGMTIRQMTDALRAALWYGSRAGGVDMSKDLSVRLPELGELTAPGKVS